MSCHNLPYVKSKTYLLSFLLSQTKLVSVINDSNKILDIIYIACTRRVVYKSDICRIQECSLVPYEGILSKNIILYYCLFFSFIFLRSCTSSCMYTCSLPSTIKIKYVTINLLLLLCLLSFKHTPIPYYLLLHFVSFSIVYFASFPFPFHSLLLRRHHSYCNCFLLDILHDHRFPFP